jgi:hypothetical protein
MRVFDIAKIMGISVTELMITIRQLGIGATSHMSPLSETDNRILLDHFRAPKKKSLILIKKKQPKPHPPAPIDITPPVAEITDCPMCKAKLSGKLRPIPSRNAYWLECPRCGDFGMTTQELLSRSNYSEEQKGTISVFCRERKLRELTPPFLISDGGETDHKDGTLYISFESILQEYSLPSVTERLDKALLRLADRGPHPGDAISLTINDIPILYSVNEKEAIFILLQLYKKGFLEKKVNDLQSPLPASAQPGVKNIAILSSDGWSRVEYLRSVQTGNQSNQVFVAMFFDASMDEAYSNAIVPSIVAAGFKPFRIDLKEHNNQISDEIIAEMKRSRFMVAEFTKHRQSVYYEAVFMHGLGRPVIFCCRQDQMDEAHFDTRQYNHIIWGGHEELQEKLTNRIRATILETR